MSEQLFRIVRAPEAKALTAQDLKSLLWRHRDDSEWEVIEVRLTGNEEPATPGQLIPQRAEVEKITNACRRLRVSTGKIVPT